MTNLNSYCNVTKATSYKEGLQDAMRQGYTHLYRWINSDLGWTFFAKSIDEAAKEAVELYLSERGKKVSKSMTYEEAEKYYSEYVDIIEIGNEIEENK